MPRFRHRIALEIGRLAETQEKMENWIANGAQLGWLIDPYRRNAHIYQPGHDVSVFTGKTLKGIGTVEGLTLNLARMGRDSEE